MFPFRLQSLKMTAGRRTMSYFTLLLLLVLVAISFPNCSSGGEIGQGRRRVKRNIGQFGRMIRLTTGMEALLFNNYGNHCGSGNTSSLPITDRIDQCCRDHDICYESASSGPCAYSFFGPYLAFYTWSIDGHRNIECVSTETDCKLATCHCDRTAAFCFGRHAAAYNSSNKHNSFWDWLM